MKVNYIVETGRLLLKGITKHKPVMKMNDRRNVITVHVWNIGHHPNCDATGIVEMELNHS